MASDLLACVIQFDKQGQIEHIHTFSYAKSQDAWKRATDYIETQKKRYPDSTFTIEIGFTQD